MKIFKSNRSICNSGAFVHLLRNYEILFSLEIPSYEKLAMTSQFVLTLFYDVIIHDSVFLLSFLTLEFQILLRTISEHLLLPVSDP